MKKLLNNKESFDRPKKSVGNSAGTDSLTPSLSLVIFFSIIAFFLWKMISSVISASFLITGIIISIAISANEIIKMLNEKEKD